MYALVPKLKNQIIHCPNFFDRMRKLVFFLLFSVSLQGQYDNSKQSYAASDLKKIILTHKTVAIIPSNASINYTNIPKGLDAEMRINDEKKMGNDIQAELHSYILQKADFKNVRFLDLGNVNARLNKVNFYEKRDDFLPQTLCKILNVDAVIMSNSSWEKPVSENDAVRNPYASLEEEFHGDVEDYVSIGGKVRVPAGSLTIQIYAAKEGKLLWRLHKDIVDSPSSSIKELMMRLMNKFSGTIPYERN